MLTYEEKVQFLSHRMLQHEGMEFQKEVELAETQDFLDTLDPEEDGPTVQNVEKRIIGINHELVEIRSRISSVQKIINKVKTTEPEDQH